MTDAPIIPAVFRGAGVSERKNTGQIRPRLRPKSAGKERGERFPTAKASILARLGKRALRKKSLNPRGRQGLSRIDARIDAASARRAVVKLSYQRLNDYGKKAAWAHLRYITREGNELYGRQGVVDLEREMGRSQMAGEKVLFRLVVAPEDGGPMPQTL